MPGAIPQKSIFLKLWALKKSWPSIYSCLSESSSTITPWVLRAFNEFIKQLTLSLPSTMMISHDSSMLRAILQYRPPGCKSWNISLALSGRLSLIL